MKKVVKYVEMITMATFMKLLAINIVASSFLGRCIKSNALSLALFLCDLSFSTSAGFREKNAVSEPEINPDAISRIIKIRKVKISSIGKSVNNSVIKTDKGSG